MNLSFVQSVTVQITFQRLRMLALLFGIFFVSVQGHYLPTGVTLCHRSDPGFTQCMGKRFGQGLAKFANGSKYYDIPVLEPLFIKEIVFAGVPSETISMVQNYTNAYFYGLTNSNTEKDFKIDLDDDPIIVMDVETPIIRMTADYQLSGKLLVFPVNGHGKCNITLYRLMNLHTMKMEKYTVKGKTHLRVTNYTMNMRIDNILYEFENVFPGNEQISAEILKTVNENGLAIFADVKSGFEQVFSAIHMALANKFYSKIPLNEIFLD